MINYKDASLDKVSAHFIGNKANGDELLLSKIVLNLYDDKLKDILKKFFLPQFATEGLYAFDYPGGDFKQNLIYNLAEKLFDRRNDFQEYAIKIAKHLFEVTSQPEIKPGDLFIAQISDLCIDDEIVDAIGIFKSENKKTFLKLDNDLGDFSLYYDHGIGIEKIDKGCLIFETEKDSGYRVCIVDKATKAADAFFWKEIFLQVKPCSDEYHQTKEFLDIAKDYVTTTLTEEFEMNKTEQIDILNRSLDYFKTHDNFDKTDFETEVFKEPDMIKSFQKFDETYRESKPVIIEENFAISPKAVRKQAKIFKSVLKLDNNFDIYIHGNKNLIQQGVEKDGRRYYKIYYEREV